MCHNQPEKNGEKSKPGDNQTDLPKEVQDRINKDPEAYVKERTEELKKQIGKAHDHGTTMSVAVVEDENGKRHVVISTNEDGNYLRPGVDLKPGEKLADGKGRDHAEIKITNYIKDHPGSHLVTIGATRPVCPDPCQEELKSGKHPGSTIATPEKAPPKGK